MLSDKKAMKDNMNFVLKMNLYQKFEYLRNIDCWSLFLSLKVSFLNKLVQKCPENYCTHGFPLVPPWFPASHDLMVGYKLSHTLLYWCGFSATAGITGIGLVKYLSTPSILMAETEAIKATRMSFIFEKLNY